MSHLNINSGENHPHPDPPPALQPPNHSLLLGQGKTDTTSTTTETAIDPTNGLSGYSATFFTNPTSINRKKTLIREVRKFPIIWKYDHPQYKSMNERGNAWIEIAQQCDLPVTTVKRMWHALCYSYANERREPQSTWIFSKDLEFMEYNFTGEAAAEREKHAENSGSTPTVPKLSKISNRIGRIRRGYSTVTDPEVVATKNRLIDEVYKFPVIWKDDVDYPSKRNKEITIPIWEEINQTVGLPNAKQCQNLWSQLRAGYNNERSRLKPRRKWLYADKLRFLETNYSDSAEVLEQQAKWYASLEQKKSSKPLKFSELPEEERVELRKKFSTSSTDKNLIRKKMMLIQQVYQHEVLWKKELNHLRLQQRAQMSQWWKDIAKKCGYSVEDAKNSWFTLRQNYLRYRTSKRSHRWQFFRCLKFLEYNLIGIEETPVFDFPELDPSEENEENSNFSVQGADDNDDNLSDDDCDNEVPDFTCHDSPPPAFTSTSISSTFKANATNFKPPKNCLFCHSPPLKSGSISNAFQKQISTSFCWLLQLDPQFQQLLSQAQYCLKCYEFLCDIVHLHNMLKSLQTKIEPARSKAKETLMRNYENLQGSKNALLTELAKTLGFESSIQKQTENIDKDCRPKPMCSIFCLKAGNQQSPEEILTKNTKNIKTADEQNWNMNTNCYTDADEANLSEANQNTDFSEAVSGSHSGVRSRSPRKRRMKLAGPTPFEIKEEPESDGGYSGNLSRERPTRSCRMNSFKMETEDIDIDDDNEGEDSEMIDGDVASGQSEHDDEEYEPEVEERSSTRHALRKSNNERNSGKQKLIDSTPNTDFEDYYDSEMIHGDVTSGRSDDDDEYEPEEGRRGTRQGLRKSQNKSHSKKKKDIDSAQPTEAYGEYSYEMVPVKLGLQQVNFQNYLFGRKAHAGGLVYRYCTQKCGSSLKFDGDKIIKAKIKHNHPDDSELIKKLKEREIWREKSHGNKPIKCSYVPVKKRRKVEESNVNDDGDVPSGHQSEYEEYETEAKESNDSNDDEYEPEEGRRGTRQGFRKSQNKNHNKKKKVIDSAQHTEASGEYPYEMVSVKLGLQQVNFENYLFGRKAQAQGHVYRYCTQKCGSSIKFDSDKIIKVNLKHNHPDDSELIQKLKEREIWRQKTHGNEPIRCSYVPVNQKPKIDESNKKITRKGPPQRRDVTYDYKCPRKGCKKGFMLEFVFQAHLKEHDGDTTPFHCKDCLEKFSTVEEFTNHRGKAHIIQPSSSIPGNAYKFKCVECDIEFLTRIAKVCHDTEYHPIHGKPACRICTKILSSRDEILPHEALHKPNEFNCVVCTGQGNNFNSSEELINHVKEIHEKVVCHECGKMLPSNRINYHLQCHEAKKKAVETGHVCQECGLFIPTKTKFYIHMKSKHAQQPSYCSYPQCSGKTFSCKMSLSNHVRRVHRKNEYKFVCKICKSKFIKHSELDRHVSKYPNGDCVTVAYQAKKSSSKGYKRRSKNHGYGHGEQEDSSEEDNVEEEPLNLLQNQAHNINLNLPNYSNPTGQGSSFYFA